ncbi:hypothetical protein B0J12DRAFT_575019 [Macrophomina phaseolina]|uniref:Fe2OG dioxygenase domain-containing protein n=1 Tax=Macrophomina phaseolina TaxID=35725 RepID=A0ABQ8G8H5_9PEZI|nr:hypothetical protein B0J12DRAFT_575019 [Macrophomina phaseolina]
MPLPVIDAHALHSGTAEELAAFDRELFSAFVRDGAVKLKNTAISDDQIERTFQTCKDFFRLPAHVKNLVANDPTQAQQRGYSVAGEEKTWFLESAKAGGPAPKHGDARESIDIGAVIDTQFPNKWLPEHVLPQHRAIMEAFFSSCADLCTSILTSLARARQLPRADAFAARCSHAASTARSNHYPAVEGALLEAGDVGRAWPHRDFGIITLVFPGTVGGLEYENREKAGSGGVSFEPVGFTSPADIVVQAAETLQRWTNDEVRACLHRVARPDAQEMGEDGLAPERTSLVFFCKADRDVSVGPMPEFVRGGEEPVYEEMTALEYQGQRNKAHYPG